MTSSPAALLDKHAAPPSRPRRERNAAVPSVGAPGEERALEGPSSATGTVELDRPRGRTEARDAAMRQALVDAFDPRCAHCAARSPKWRDADGDLACAPGTGCAVVPPPRPPPPVPPPPRGLWLRGECRTIADWARLRGVPYSTLWHRLYTARLPLAEALSLPLTASGSAVKTWKLRGAW